MTAISLVFRQSEDGALVAPPSCTLLTIPDLLSLVQRCAADGGPVVVDLSEVVEVDMAAFRSLVWSRRYCARRSVRFALVAAPRGVFTAQQEALVRDLLPVFPDRASARRGVPAQRLRDRTGRDQQPR